LESEPVELDKPGALKVLTDVSPRKNKRDGNASHPRLSSAPLLIGLIDATLEGKSMASFKG
jgi:hypothetical protein